MKKLILVGVIVGLAATSVQTGKAGDREWAVVGKVLTGVAAASVITHAVACAPGPGCYSYSCPAPVYRYGYCAPAPRVVYMPPAPVPVAVYRAPVCVAPAPIGCYAPVVRVRVGFGGYRHFRPGCW